MTGEYENKLGLEMANQFLDASVMAARKNNTTSIKQHLRNVSILSDGAPTI